MKKFNKAEKFDLNKDGKFDIRDIIVFALKQPGIYVKREDFLKKELYMKHDLRQVAEAIETTPAQAGISSYEIDRIADSVIRFERNCVSGIAFILGFPGGWAMSATIPADIAQYYAYTLRAIQKLLYLYGFPDIKSKDGEIMLDTETINEMLLCLGVMNGLVGANNAIKGMAKALANGVEKKLLKAALAKGAVYPFIKNVMKWFGVKLTKEMFAGFFKKGIPVVGGFVGGGITFVAFKSCCDRLKKELQDTYLSNPNHISSKEEDEFYEDIKNGFIDVNYEETESDE